MIEKSILITDKFKFDFNHMLCSLAFIKISTSKSRFISFLVRSSPENHLEFHKTFTSKLGTVKKTPKYSNDQNNDTFEIQKILQIKKMLKLTLSINQFQTSDFKYTSSIKFTMAITVFTFTVSSKNAVVNSYQ